ncbi:MAG: sigma 54-interacting transcriptional regulator [Sandaracinaceae bacterium]
MSGPDGTRDRTATDPRGRGSGAPTLRGWVLRVDAGWRAPIVLGRAPLRIGRRGHVVSPLALDDDLVSREHAEIRPWDGGYVLVDASSKNGTFVDGARVTEHQLEHGDLIRIGGVLLLYGRSARVPEEISEGSLRGADTTLADLRDAIDRVAPLEVPVLIEGESGSGKELVARGLHDASGRAGRFVPVNVAALPDALAEAELFGHERHAFTGAADARAGLFRAAHGGTLFLDEIAELSAPLQAKLLRALSARAVRPVGGELEVPVDVRVVAATHRALAEEVTAGRFRGDLYARLDGARLRVPPLRERRADIPSLARALGPEGVGLSSDALEALILYAWPYNVRELEQVLASARPAEGRSLLERSDLPARVLDAGVPDASDGEPGALRAALAAERGNVAAAAARLGLSRHQLHRALARHGVDASAFRGVDRDALIAALRDHRGNVARVARELGRDRRQIYRWLAELGIDAATYRGEP